MEKIFKSNGKLLLTSEYLVLDGALALAVPCQLGQSLSVTPSDNNQISWTSLTHNNQQWYKATLFNNNNTDPVSQTLEGIIKAAMALNPNFNPFNSQVITKLDFDKNWGLGSSSTLINNIAQWAGVNPFQLLFNSFSGSGYDIACAYSSTPILYKLSDNKPIVYPVLFNPPFSDNLFFVYLEKKQNSREGIAQYKKLNTSPKKLKPIIDKISLITQDILRTNSLQTFCNLLNEHETIISSCINLPKVKDKLFPDFHGSIKSLGAWGGDFVLAVADKDYTHTYFKSKGYNNIIPFSDMVLSNF